MAKSYSTAAEPTIRRLISHYPMAAGTRQRALNLLLFNVGTGYCWVNGRLVYTQGGGEWATRQRDLAAQARQEKEEKPKRNRKAAKRRKSLAAMPPREREIVRRMYKQSRDAAYRFKRKISCGLQWESPPQYCPILTVPDDVDPGWKAVCIEACKAFLAVPKRFILTRMSRGSVEEGRKVVQEALTGLQA